MQPKYNISNCRRRGFNEIIVSCSIAKLQFIFHIHFSSDSFARSLACQPSLILTLLSPVVASPTMRCFCVYGLLPARRRRCWMKRWFEWEVLNQRVCESCKQNKPWVPLEWRRYFSAAAAAVVGSTDDGHGRRNDAYDECEITPSSNVVAQCWWRRLLSAGAAKRRPSSPVVMGRRVAPGE